MSQEDFNRSLSEYIRNKKRKEVAKKQFFKKKPAKKVSEEFPDLQDDQVHIIPEKKPFYHRIVKNMGKKRKKEAAAQEPETEEFEAEEQEIDEEIQRSPTFLEKMSGFFGLGRRRTPEEIDSMPYNEYDEESELRSELETIERREEELNVERDELDMKRKELTKKLISIIEYKKGEEMRKDNIVSLDEYQNLEEDLIAISKITTSLIHSLPKRKVDSFKDSEDFKSFKQILKRRNLIRQ